MKSLNVLHADEYYDAAEAGRPRPFWRDMLAVSADRRATTLVDTQVTRGMLYAVPVSLLLWVPIIICLAKIL